ncbi:ATP-binding protein [Phenylobacterium sp.]|uniref:ATP-binding protein n=1 Tax=Phenylobacterium sp. TaxID=1871053 RepID=UPI00271DD317|nr:ATP-binding protein [Phenylobacterium sp.]MDO8377605.1 ATP-binding protein [Phenylobacterium sp.]
MPQFASPAFSPSNPVGPPFGMTGDEPVFTRAAELADALFGKVGVSLMIARDEGVWRSHDPEGRTPAADPLGDRVRATGKCVWVEDARLDPEMAAYPLVSGPPHYRFCAGAPVRLSDGEVIGVLAVVGTETRPHDAGLAANLDNLAGVIADACEQARAQQMLVEGKSALRQSQTHLTAMVETAPAAIMMTDRDMRLLQVSRRFLQESGMAAPDILGRQIADFNPSLFTRLRLAHDRCLAGETLRIDRVRLIAPDGLAKWVCLEMTPWRDEAGEIGGVVSAALEVTDLVRAVETAERSEQRLQVAAQIAELHVWELDYQHRTLVQDEGMAKIFGRVLTFEELAADTSSTIHPEDRALIAAPWARAVEKDEPYFPEYRVAREDGKEVWVACTVKLVRDETGAPLRLLGALQNITARKQAEAALVQAKEEAEAANRAKSTFLATMSHEIRTPLNGVLGMAQAMARDELSPVQRDRLDVVRQSGETLLAILNDVLDLSKIEAGKLELEVAAFDLEELALGAHAAFTAIANKKGLSFNLVVEPEARGAYLGDSTRLRQVIYNLVSNALKFTPSGEVRVRLARDGGDLCVEVSDTGVGMSPDQLDRLFRKFEQADASTTRRYGGTGLGLAICRELCELMGGAIGAVSVEGEGTTFIARLPMAPAQAGSVQGPAAAEAEPETLPPLRVLAAEDNIINQLVLQTLLHQAGIEPVMVSDGAQAVEAWRAGAWDVILMDVQMPVMDGPTATRKIRDEEARLGRPRTPIVALTANAMAHQVAEYIGAGMDDFVPKPLEAALLFAALERTLEAA